MKNLMYSVNFISESKKVTHYYIDSLDIEIIAVEEENGEFTFLDLKKKYVAENFESLEEMYQYIIDSPYSVTLPTKPKESRIIADVMANLEISELHLEDSFFDLFLTYDEDKEIFTVNSETKDGSIVSKTLNRIELCNFDIIEFDREVNYI